MTKENNVMGRKVREGREKRRMGKRARKMEVFFCNDTASTEIYTE